MGLVKLWNYNFLLLRRVEVLPVETLKNYHISLMLVELFDQHLLNFLPILQVGKFDNI